MSYNPRPARVGVILLAQAGLKDPLAVALAMMLSVDAQCEDVVCDFGSELGDLLVLARSQPRVLELMCGEGIDGFNESRQKSEDLYIAVTAVLAERLDFARHIHQMKFAPDNIAKGALTKAPEEQPPLRHELYTHLASYVALARTTNHQLAKSFNQWEKRFLAQS